MFLLLRRWCRRVEVNVMPLETSDSNRHVAPLSFPNPLGISLAEAGEHCYVFGRILLARGQSDKVRGRR